MSYPELDILKSPSGQEMVSSVTTDFYSRSYLGLWLFQAMGKEWDDYGDWVSDLTRELNPKTAAWSLPMWEAEYGIPIGEGLSIEFRQQRLYAKIVNVAPINPATIERAVTALTGNLCKVTENVGPSTQLLTIHQTYPFDLNTVKKLIDEIKPSHQTFIFALEGVFQYAENSTIEFDDNIGFANISGRIGGAYGGLLKHNT